MVDIRLSMSVADMHPGLILLNSHEMVICITSLCLITQEMGALKRYATTHPSFYLFVRGGKTGGFGNGSRRVFF